MTEEEVSQPKKYLAAICVPNCGCRVCPGQTGFDTYMQMVRHEHVLCIHEAQWLDDLLNNPPTDVQANMQANKARRVKLSALRRAFEDTAGV